MNDVTDGRIFFAIGILIFIVIWSGILNPGKFYGGNLFSPFRSISPVSSSWSGSEPASFLAEGQSVKSLQTDYLYRNVPPEERQRLLERLKRFEEEKRHAEETKNRVIISNNTAS